MYAYTHIIYKFTSFAHAHSLKPVSLLSICSLTY